MRNHLSLLLIAAALAQTLGAKKPPKAPVLPVPPPCVARFEDGLDKNGIAVKGEKGVSGPTVRFTPEAELSDEARRAGRRRHGLYAASKIAFVVEKDGTTRDLCLLRAAGYALDGNAAKAISQYMFDPATKNGEPVAIRISAEVDFVMR